MHDDSDPHAGTASDAARALPDHARRTRRRTPPARACSRCSPMRRCLQYRNKRADRAPQRRQQADALRVAVRARGVPLIVNDDAAPRARPWAPTACTWASTTARSPTRARVARRRRDHRRLLLRRHRARARCRRARRGLPRVRRVLRVADQADARACRARPAARRRGRSDCRWWRSAASRRTMRRRCSAAGADLVAVISGVSTRPIPSPRRAPIAACFD